MQKAYTVNGMFRLLGRSRAGSLLSGTCSACIINVRKLRWASTPIEGKGPDPYHICICHCEPRDMAR